MKLTITYVAAGHSATESDLTTMLATVREEFPAAIAYTRDGGEAHANADLTEGVDVLVWEDHASALNDDGRHAIAKVTVSA